MNISITEAELLALAKDPQIIALFLTGMLEVFRRILQPRALIHWGLSHGFSFSVPQDQGGNLSLYTMSILVRNAGRAAAKQIEFYFNFKPEHFQIWPVIQHTTEMTSDKRFVIKVDFLKPDETFSIELIQSHGSPPDLLNVRAIEGKAKTVPMAPMQIYPRWFSLLCIGIFIVGSYQLLVWLIKFIQL